MESDEEGTYLNKLILQVLEPCERQALSLNESTSICKYLFERYL